MNEVVLIITNCRHVLLPRGKLIYPHIKPLTTQWVVCVAPTMPILASESVLLVRLLYARIGLGKASATCSQQPDWGTKLAPQWEWRVGQNDPGVQRFARSNNGTRVGTLPRVHRRRIEISARDV